jgi:hypothetical protein
MGETKKKPSRKDKLKTTFKEIKDKYLEQLGFLKEFAFVVIIYGIMVCFILSQLTEVQFNIQSILTWGLVSYIVKAELPQIIKNSLPKRPPMFPMD